MSNYSVLAQNGYKSIVYSVEEYIPQFIRCLLYRIRETGLSYEKIGKLINTEKSTVKKLIDGTWYPRTRRAENILLSNIFKVKISDFELKEEELGDARGMC
jgi:hypothetical protein